MTGAHQVHWLPMALALLLALMSLWLNRLTDRPTLVDNGGFSHDPDYIVENFDALTFTVTGQPQYRLSAERMTHYMDDDTTVLLKPIFQSQDREQPTEVRAMRAQISGDGQFVHFLDQVHIVRRDPDGGPPTTLDTNYLRVAPNQHTMFTDQPITLRRGNSLIHAAGMTADDRKRLLILTGGVRGIYEDTR